MYFVFARYGETVWSSVLAVWSHHFLEVLTFWSMTSVVLLSHFLAVEEPKSFEPPDDDGGAA